MKNQEDKQQRHIFYSLFCSYSLGVPIIAEGTVVTILYLHLDNNIKEIIWIFVSKQRMKQNLEAVSLKRHRSYAAVNSKGKLHFKQVNFKACVG